LEKNTIWRENRLDTKLRYSRLGKSKDRLITRLSAQTIFLQSDMF